MSDLDYDYMDHNGVGRMLGWHPPTSPESSLLMAGATTFGAWLDSNNLTMLKRPQWRQIDRRKVLDEKYLLDQHQCNGCCGYSGTSLLMRLRGLKGMSFQRLSGSSLYARVNHNQDRGACITDCLDALEQYGVCLEEEFDYPNIYLRQMPASAVQTAKRFRLRFGLKFALDDGPIFDQMVCALHYDFLLQFPIKVQNGVFDHADADGAVGFSNGQGNHSVEADGCVFSPSGEMMLDMPNTWGVNWFVFKNGRGYVKERHIKGAAADQDAFAQIDVVVDAQELDETKPQAQVT